MQFLVLYLCVLPALSSARVWVELNTHKDDLNKQVNIVGRSYELLKKPDIKYFKIDDVPLREKIGSFFGQRPDDIYLNGPTPYGDMYTAFGWTPVTKLLEARKAQVLTVNTGPTMLTTQIFQNDDDDKVTFESIISHPIKNEVVSTWVKETDVINMEDSIRYSFNINGTSIGGLNELQYVAPFARNQVKTFPGAVGSKTSIQVNLEPNKKVIAELYANLEIMSIQVDYQIALDGYVAANYQNGFREHHFWSFYINDLLNFAKIRPFVVASEIIKINYYTDPKVVLRDTYSNNVLCTIPMNFM